MRRRVKTHLVAATLMLCGCTAQSWHWRPGVVLDTGMGALPLNQPASAMLEGVQAPPSGPWAAPVPAQPVNRDGYYAGTGVVLSPDGGLCIRPMTITGFVVRGNAVEFDRSQGTISANGGLQMAANGNWIIGSFDGAAFRGELLVDGPRGRPGCTYILTLARTGP